MGVASVIANQENFHLEKLEMCIPHNLEVVWGLLSSKSDVAKFKKFILCSFYSPPKSRKKQKLTDHLVTTLQMLASKYPDAPIIMGADKIAWTLDPSLTLV